MLLMLKLDYSTGFSKWRTPEDVAEGEDYKTNINPDSLKVLNQCKLEPIMANAIPGENFSFSELAISLLILIQRLTNLYLTEQFH